MKILNFFIKNFGSYEELNFDDLNLGLTLISGETGSGKSTFLDAASWLLFGETSKDTSVDEVKRWNALEATSGSITINNLGEVITIHRVRGKVQENDLYFTVNSNPPTRGKNISETQDLINQRLGFDSEFYFNTTYFHQFSRAETFFISKSSERRAIFEKIVDQSLAIEIAEGAASARKNTKKVIEERKRANERAIGKKEQLEASKDNTRLSRDNWINQRDKFLFELEKKVKNFEQEKTQKINRLQQLSDKFINDNNIKLDKCLQYLQNLEHHLTHIKGASCPTCGKSDKDTEKAVTEQKMEALRNDIIRISEIENPYIQQIDQVKQQVNNYESQLELEKVRINPFVQEYEKLDHQLNQIISVIEAQAKEINELETHLHKINFLYDLSFDFRGALLSKVIKQIEVNTNLYLESHFESQLKVTFDLSDADKLEVEIQKDGNICSFKQLSGGQRTMLKLCFWLATKKSIENKYGVHLNILCFDESFNGLDDSLKEQSFGLLQNLENTHDSIFVIDHQESFKNYFTTEFKAEIIGDVSSLLRIK